jgi:predicted Fe-Mo cluster-binding NifX family protein
MKIAITTAGDNLDAAVDPRFGRAPKFLLYHSETAAFTIEENTQNLNAAQGAGIQSALHLCNEMIDCVITGNCGPKAFATLDAAGIAIYTCKAITISKAIEQFKAGKLTKAESANVEAHWV